MGCCFSSQPEPEEIPREIQRDDRPRIRPPQNVHQQYNSRREINFLRTNSLINDNSFHSQRVIDIDRDAIRSNQNQRNIRIDKNYKLVPLSRDRMTKLILRKIHNKNIIVTEIYEIDNQLLRAMYEMKKMKMTGAEEYELFHGTKIENVDSICRNNFDRGRCKHFRFGHGVNFSSIPTYASVYSDNDKNKKNVMFLVKVLIRNKCLGNERMIFPPLGYDTTLKNLDDLSVVVKYESDEFYPAYLIIFTYSPGYIPKIRV